MNSKSLEVVSEKLDNIADSIETCANAVLDIDDHAYKEQLESIAYSLAYQTEDRMGKHLQDFTDTIERAVSTYNNEATTVDKIARDIKEKGWARIAGLDRRIEMRLRKNYPFCTINKLESDYHSETCTKKCFLTMFANDEELERHRSENHSIGEHDGKRRRRISSGKIEEISESLLE